ncbi:hypothetical protein BLNAU_4153 [Blattamonas nauphoetae]|uniref:Transposase n=1 Tax=Blattamonas nauphoetae TaxID=2049346 RepID=A0ABQ9YAQ4_9EUKA|nr:hypothetical protein BLNAU_4153 [Blattamonas nauphoetae]
MGSASSNLGSASRYKGSASRYQGRYLDQTVNRHNRYYYSRTNPHYHVEIPNSRRGLNIWCAISSLGLVGPIIYDGTMTQDKYRQMLQREFFPVRRELDPEGTSWLMQDGAPAHTANETVETLQELEQMIREAVASLSQEKIQDAES